LNCDINGDGLLNSFDIDPFADLLVSDEIKGDMNCDRCITEDDIDPFVLALTDPDEYELEYPDCPIMNADVNDDGYINVYDIDPFYALVYPPCDE
jgi:hypothetical protein